MSTATSSATEEGAVKQSDAVKKATTLEETGFPVNTPDGQIMATKSVDPETGETVIEGENGTLEISEDPHVLQPEGTAASNLAKQAAASESDPPKKQQSKSEN